jgi:hypothetical protein
LGPFTCSVADLMPAWSPSVSSRKSTLMPWALAQRVYIRSSMPGPVAGLGAAGPGVDFHEGVVAVRLAGEQRLQFGAAGAFPDAFELRSRLLEAGLVALLIGQLGVAHGVGQVAFQALHGLHRGGQARALAAHRLRLVRLIPQRRVLDPGVQFIEFSKRDIPVKDAS